MMRRLIGRGMAVILVTGGVCWTAAQFKQCPASVVARLLRSAIGGPKSADSTPACSGARAPVIVDLSPTWLKDSNALFPDDSLKLEDVIPPRERSKELDLIDLGLLSEAANLARPNYEEEEAGLTEAPVTASCSAGETGPEARRPVLVESTAKPGYMHGGAEAKGHSPRFMPYAADSPAPTGAATEEESEESQLHWFGAGFRSSTGIIHLEEPPLCQEDPAAPYQYPGCPYIGPRPQAEKKNSPTMPKADKPPTTPGDNRGADARPTTIKHHVTLKPSIPTRDDVSPNHPEVDTMEFRPSDAGAVDFIHQKRIY